MSFMDNFTHPTVAVPIVGTSGIANFLGENLPLLINIGSFIYIVLLVGHKAYTMYKEWKKDNESSQ